MRKFEDVLRLKLDARLSHDQIATSLGISKGAVSKYVGKAAAAGLDHRSADERARPPWSGKSCTVAWTDRTTMCCPTTGASIRSYDARE